MMSTISNPAPIEIEHVVVDPSDDGTVSFTNTLNGFLLNGQLLVLGKQLAVREKIILRFPPDLVRKKYAVSKCLGLGSQSSLGSSSFAVGLHEVQISD